MRDAKNFNNWLGGGRRERGREGIHARSRLKWLLMPSVGVSDEESVDYSDEDDDE
jgi:hypothetical protein